MRMRVREILTLMLEDEEKAFKILLKEKLINKEKTLIDEIFINYQLAEYYHKKDNELKYYYIDELEKIFSCQKNREIFKIDYVKFLNLYTNVYEKKINVEKFNSILDIVRKISLEINNNYYYNKMKDKIYKENLINQVAEGYSLDAVYT